MARFAAARKLCQGHRTAKPGMRWLTLVCRAGKTNVVIFIPGMHD
ncbi:hypothetical protein PQR02_12985 [Paraburkholderia sediminicola]|uniref:Uncharacterized protein n=1 Tax=Paraburkholderia rhynchosiae TaxID=487049 RepID=A0ACC7N7T8_9BURK